MLLVGLLIELAKLAREIVLLAREIVLMRRDTAKGGRDKPTTGARHRLRPKKRKGRRR